MERRRRFGENGLQFPAPRLECGPAKIAIAFGQHVEEDDRSRNLLGKHLHSRRRGMKPQLQRFEIQAAVLRDNDLTVEHTTSRKLGLERIQQFREVADQGFFVAALDKDFVSITEYQGSK